MIYVASSWRNPHYDGVRDKLRAMYGTDAVYDFKAGGFRWRDLMNSVPADDDPAPGVQGPERHILTDARQLAAFLADPRAVAHFQQDFEALRKADTLVLVLPCGRSAHSEYGFAVARGMNTVIHQLDPVEPELMYSWADWMTDDTHSLIRALTSFGYRIRYEDAQPGRCVECGTELVGPHDGDRWCPAPDCRVSGNTGARQS